MESVIEKPEKDFKNTTIFYSIVYSLCRWAKVRPLMDRQLCDLTKVRLSHFAGRTFACVSCSPIPGAWDIPAVFIKFKTRTNRPLERFKTFLKEMKILIF